MKEQIYKYLHGFGNSEAFKESSLSKLSTEIIGIAVGLLLGDQTIYATKTKGPYLKIENDYKQKDFVYYVHNLLKDLTVYKYLKDSLRNGALQSYYFYTVSSPVWQILYDLFIVNKKKVYKTGIIQNYLTNEGLKVWIMADGSLNKQKGYMTIYTEAFSKEEVFSICQDLNKKYQINSHALHKKRYLKGGKVNLNHPGYWIVYIPKVCVQKLANQIQLPPFMQYKFPGNLSVLNYIKKML